MVLDARGTGSPVIVHWGADLGELSDEELRHLAEALVPAVAPSSIDRPLRLTLLPVASDGWTGMPALAGFRDSSPAYPRLRLTGVEVTLNSAIEVRLDDADAGLTLTIQLELDDHGVLETRSTLTNLGRTPWNVSRLAVTLPLSARATEVLDFSGRWAFERRAQRRALDHGAWARRSAHGRTGHDSAVLFAVGTPGFGFRSGEVWAAHVAWSGDQEIVAEYYPTGHSLISGAELLQPGEIILAPGQSYSTPPLVATWSTDGLDGISARLHARLRNRHPLTERPIVLNTWEAVYFRHEPRKLIDLAERAASVGVERFVLDDGWMTGRTDDRKALGDWTVDAVRWPDGLHPLVTRVRDLGMDFGLWVEPEMVSRDSDLARKHPDWILHGSPTALPQPWRHQYALDLDNPAAFANILGQLCALLEEYPIAYLKWDQNRDLLGGSAHRQTAATYRLMDELRARYPQLEIESCSSGGARIDLGVVQRTDRVWTSDNNDPLERQSIQRYTSLLLPPEWLGSHLGDPVAHTTGRTSDLSFRFATALFWSAGIEWDLTRASASDLAAIGNWIAVHKSLRRELHSGTVVRADATDPAIQVHGVVSPDRRSAIFAVICLTAARDAIPGPVVFPGLEPAATYRVAPVDLGQPPRFLQDEPPPWFVGGSVVLSGRTLESVGLPMPVLAPAQALVLRFVRS